MRMTRFALILAVASLAACKKQEEAKPVTPTPAKADTPVVAKPVEAAKVAKPGAELEKYAATSLATASADMAQFSLGDSKGSPGCEQYAKDLAQVFTGLQAEYKAIQEDMAKGSKTDPYERLGAYLKGAAEKLKLTKTTPELQPIHDQLVAGLGEMGDAMIELAVATRNQDGPAGTKATDKLTAADKALGSAFAQLKKACGT